MTAPSLLEELRGLYAELRDQMRARFDRRVAFGDLITDRWDNARAYGFGEGTSCYDNVLILGDVKVGRHTWIGPNVILDGRGGLEIGDHVSISAGVQIYSHHTVAKSTSMGEAPEERAPTVIGDGVYLGPQTVVQMGVTVGDRAVIGAMSLVNRSIPADARAWGCPARVQAASLTAPAPEAGQQGEIG